MKGRTGRCNLTTSKADQTTANVYRCRLPRCYGSNWPIKSNNNPWSRVDLVQFDSTWNERLQMTGSAQSWKAPATGNGRRQCPADPVEFVRIYIELAGIKRRMVRVSTYENCSIIVVFPISPSNNEPFPRSTGYLCPLADGKVRCPLMLPNDLCYIMYNR